MAVQAANSISGDTKMALPSAWDLILPNLNLATVIGVVCILLAIFGGPIFRLIGKGLSIVSGGRVKDNVIISFLVVAGIILIWGVSIFQDLFSNTDFVLITSVVLFFVALLIILIDGPRKQVTSA